MISTNLGHGSAKARDDASDPTPNGSPTWATIWILYFLVPRNLQKKTPYMLNNTMEDYRNKVVNYQPIYSRLSANLLVKPTESGQGGCHRGRV